MNLEAHSSLWRSIQQFPLDDPGAAINFSRKLAAQQNWSPAFTQQAIEEYRKFIFLCCIAPNGASPGKVVDEVWHLHLTYTQSYWTDFCKNTLGKDIHHHPSKGGNEENHKHEQWYHETLQLYESVFGSSPPADIWPPPKTNPPQIPKSGLRIRSKTKALITLALLVPLLVIAALYQELNPFSLTGPQFLLFFPLLFLGALTCFILLQDEKGHSIIALVTENFPTDATIYQLAQFLYGKHRAIQTAIVDLVRRNLLSVSRDKSFILQKNRNHTFENDPNPLMNGYLEEISPHLKYEMIAFNWYNEKQVSHPSLEYLHQLANRKESRFKRFNFLWLPFVIGILRILQGAVNGYPIGFLVVEMFVCFIIALLVENMYSLKSILFRKVTELSKAHNDHHLLHDDHVVTDYALNGTRAIQLFSDGLIMTGIFAAYPIVVSRRGTDAGGWVFSSCSSGGDGGGSCGGGCGGCGGGGGD
jgi:uncharacterized protein (TIGR04222 family)